MDRNSQLRPYRLGPDYLEKRRSVNHAHIRKRRLQCDTPGTHMLVFLKMRARSMRNAAKRSMEREPIGTKCRRRRR